MARDATQTEIAMTTITATTKNGAVVTFVLDNASVRAKIKAKDLDLGTVRTIENNGVTPHTAISVNGTPRKIEMYFDADEYAKVTRIFAEARAALQPLLDREARDVAKEDAYREQYKFIASDGGAA